jgi:hypothetical protein
MPTLFPPEYPDRPDAPLLSFGPSFSEEIARSVIQTIWRDEGEDPREFEIRVAAGLTMLEAFHPRDHLECMLAAQGVAFHCGTMETLARAMVAGQPPLTAVKLRASASQMGRSFSTIVRDLERLQSRPLPLRPGREPTAPASGGPPDDPADPTQRPKRTRGKTAGATAPAPVEQATRPNNPPPAVFNLDDEPELPEDIETRPDGTPGSLAGYVLKPAVQQPIPLEMAIEMALATRPKPWRMVNAPVGEDPPLPVDAPLASPEYAEGRGPVDVRERIFTGDSLARFASSRLDPNAPVEPLQFEDEDSVVELELISTGGDPEAEAKRQAMMAAHPEGKPIVVFRHGSMRPAPDPADDPLAPARDENPPDT